MPRLTWLHISDLHALSPRYSWDAGEVIRSVTEDLRKLADRYRIRPDLLFFTGDAAFGRLSTCSLEAQFDEAVRVFESIRSVFGDRLPPERCFVVPGNHDIDREAISQPVRLWQDALQNVTPLVETFEKNDRASNLLREQLMARFDPYRAFLRRHNFGHCGADHPAFLYARTVEIEGVKVGIAGFNSAITCGKDGEKGHLWMAARWQVNQLVPQLEGCDLKIALVHHPDNWLHEYEDKLFRDLSLEFNFVLHGHEHDGWVDPPKASFPLKHVRLAAAALYDRADLPNGYSVCEWNSDTQEPTVYFREYSRPGRGFRTREIPNVTDDRGRWPQREEPMQSLSISPADARPSSEPALAQRSADVSGYLIDEIASATIIFPDGDCKRVVELNHVAILQASIANSRLRHCFLSETTGYIDPEFVRANVRGSSFGGFRTTFDANKRTQLRLEFGRPLSESDRFSIEYSWWALNGFVMDERQYLKQYGTNEMEELAHFPLLQPTNRLSLFVQFPAAFVSMANFDLRSSLSVQVFAVDGDGIIQSDKRQYDIEEKLRPEARFVRSLGVAFLDIPNPVAGFSYGISWRVPPFPDPPLGVKPGSNRELLAALEARLLNHRTTPDSEMEANLQEFFQGCYGLFNRYLLGPYEEEGGWSGEVELDLMIFDNTDRQLRMVSLYQVQKGVLSKMPIPEATLAYGTGVAGKAFKINNPGLWVKIPPEDRSTPDPYVRLGATDAHNVLLSIPLQNPADQRYSYGIVNIGSRDPNCPIRRLMDAREMPDVLRDLMQSLSIAGLKTLTRRTMR